VEALGGRFLIESASPRGVRLQVRLPLDSGRAGNE
jgi:signal transduction histidine kinase